MASEVKTDVLIVGAGAAGLCAARALAGAGIRCAVAEARSYVGGRVRTEQSREGDAAELGAEFVHGRPPEILKQAESAGLKIVGIKRASWASKGGALKRSEEMEDDSDEVFARLGVV